MTVIRAGVSGTNWTGKSAMIQSFVNGHPNLRIDTVELSALVERCPFPTVVEQTAQATQWMLEQVAALLDRPVTADIQLYDRSPLDILAFARYAFDREQAAVDQGLMTDIHKLVALFDVIFFIIPSDEWPLGEPPTPSEMAFALLMDRYMRKAITEYCLDVVHLPWTPSQRQQILSQHLEL